MKERCIMRRVKCRVRGGRDAKRCERVGREWVWEEKMKNGMTGAEVKRQYVRNNRGCEIKGE